MTFDARVRLATPDDGAAVARIYAPIVQWTTISFETMPPTDAEMRERIAQTLTAYPWLVCESAGDIVGYAYGTRHRPRAAYQWSVETSVYVAEGCRGRGVGRRLYSALIRVLEAQRFANLYAGIALPNDASAALHERMGFQPLGVFRRVGFKFGEWRDVGWWHRPLTDGSAEPLPPLTLAEWHQRSDGRTFL